MPERDWPPMQRRVARALRGVAYFFAVVAGLYVVTDPPDSPADGIAAAGALALGYLAIASGLTATAAVVLRIWHIEWVAVWFVAAAFGGYAVLSWAQGDGGTPAALTVAVAMLMARGVDLWVFSLSANRARRDRRRRGWPKL